MVSKPCTSEARGREYSWVFDGKLGSGEPEVSPQGFTISVGVGGWRSKMVATNEGREQMRNEDRCAGLQDSHSELLRLGKRGATGIHLHLPLIR